MSDLKPADKREADIFTTFGHSGELVLKVGNVHFETITLSHFDGEEVVVILFWLFGGRCIG